MKPPEVNQMFEWFHLCLFLLFFNLATCVMILAISSIYKEVYNNIKETNGTIQQAQTKNSR